MNQPKKWMALTDWMPAAAATMYHNSPIHTGRLVARPTRIFVCVSIDSNMLQYFFCLFAVHSSLVSAAKIAMAHWYSGHGVSPHFTRLWLLLHSSVCHDQFSFDGGWMYAQAVMWRQFAHNQHTEHPIVLSLCLEDELVGGFRVDASDRCHWRTRLRCVSYTERLADASIHHCMRALSSLAYRITGKCVVLSAVDDFFGNYLLFLPSIITIGWRMKMKYSFVPRQAFATLLPLGVINANNMCFVLDWTGDYALICFSFISPSKCFLYMFSVELNSTSLQAHAKFIESWQTNPRVLVLMFSAVKATLTHWRILNSKVKWKPQEFSEPPGGFVWFSTVLAICFRSLSIPNRLNHVFTLLFYY